MTKEHHDFGPSGGRRIRVMQVLLWVGLFVAWTVALLMPVPEAAVNAVGGPTASFWVGKVLHVSMYAVLALLIGWLPFSRRWRFALLALLVLHGGATEYFQQYFHRWSSWRDWGLDTLGATLGFSMSWCRWRRGGKLPDKAPQEHLQPDTAREHHDADHLR